MRLLVATTLLIVGCEGARQKTLRVSLTSLNAAREGFIAWDLRKQGNIVEAATSLEDGQTKLDEYRKRRERVVEAFTIAYSALAAAALDPSANMLIEAAKVAKDLYDLIKELQTP